MSVDYERLTVLLVQAKQLEVYGETQLVHALWKRVIELLMAGIDDHTEATRDFIPELPTPTASETSSEADDGLERMTRKELLIIWNDLRGKAHTIKSVFNKPELIADIRKRRINLATAARACTLGPEAARA
jgi:hypothetical protein